MLNGAAMLPPENSVEKRCAASHASLSACTRSLTIAENARLLVALQHLLDLFHVLVRALRDARHRVGLRLARDLGEILHVFERLHECVARDFGLLARIGDAG